MFEIKVDFECPFCGAPVSVLLDPSLPGQQYVEDCEVCCRPLEIRYTADGKAITAFEATALEQ